MGNVVLDIGRLRADMAAKVAATTARSFSLKVTGGKNPDFYRNFVNNGQDKRISAEVFMGIVNALERDAADYMTGMERRAGLPSATVLTSVFAVLLDSLGIPPFEDERALKLAARFPDALQSVEDLHAKTHTGKIEPRGEDSPSPDEESAARQ